MSRNVPPQQVMRPPDGAASQETEPAMVGSPAGEAEKFTVSNMSYSEMIGFYNQQIARVELAWFRIMYLHAAIVGVLVFFGEAEDFLFLQRAIVFAFFTVNLVIFRVALSEGYSGLKEAQRDLKRFPESDGHVDHWFRARTNIYSPGVRTAIMMVTWAIIGFLLFRSLILG